MNAEEIARLRARHEAAGEWYAVTENGTVDICTRKPRRPAVIALMVSPEDADCIIAEHEAVPRLCDEVKRLQREVERLRDALEFYGERNNYKNCTYFDADGNPDNTPLIDKDLGRKARAALEVK